LGNVSEHLAVSSLSADSATERYSQELMALASLRQQTTINSG
jgi:hypothetical protein